MSNVRYEVESSRSAEAAAFAHVRSCVICSPNLLVLAEIISEYHLRRVMTDAHEKRLVEALKKFDEHGDTAPAHVLVSELFRPF